MSYELWDRFKISSLLLGLKEAPAQRITASKP